MPAFDIVVIGGGIAGASLAAHLVPERRVLILEAEAQAGYHSTGRSAALFSETYGGPVVRALSRASRSFLFHPPAGFAQNPLVTPRGTLFIASQDQREALAALAREPDMAAATRPVGTAEALSLCPILAPDNLAAAILAPGTADIDVDGLHQGFLRLFRAGGGTIRTDLAALEIAPTGQGWSVGTREGAFEAGIVVDAAGAWADKVAALARVPSIGLQPLRRTALVVAAPDGARIADWPMVIDAAEQFYFKPDAGRLILSPADETLQRTVQRPGRGMWTSPWPSTASNAPDDRADRPGRAPVGRSAQLRRRPRAGGRLRSGRAGLLLARRSGGLWPADRAGARPGRRGARPGQGPAVGPGGRGGDRRSAEPRPPRPRV